ncbi:MAG: hypothetical protein ABIB04_01080, partial [Patescibacteria group bacterium]
MPQWIRIRDPVETSFPRGSKSVGSLCPKFVCRSAVVMGMQTGGAGGGVTIETVGAAEAEAELVAVPFPAASAAAAPAVGFNQPPMSHPAKITIRVARTAPATYHGVRSDGAVAVGAAAAAGGGATGGTAAAAAGGGATGGTAAAAAGGGATGGTAAAAAGGGATGGTA